MSKTGRIWGSRRPIILLAVGAALAVLIGCARLPIRENLPATPAYVLSALEMQRGSFRRFVGSGELSFHGERGAMAFRSRWEIRMPDTVQIRVFGPLGIRMGDVMVEGRQVHIFNYWLDQQESMPLDSLVFRFPGMVALKSARDLYPFPVVSRDDLAFLVPGESRPDSGIFVFQDSSGQRILYLDDKYLIIDSESVCFSTPSSILEKRYHAYRKIGRNWLPSRIRYSRGNRPTGILPVDSLAADAPGTGGQSNEWMEISFESIRVQ